MKKKQKNEKGFSTIEMLLVLVLVVLIVGAGWFVYNEHTKAKSNPSTSVTSSNNASTSAYKGWKSFCSSYGGLCLEYPPSWTLKTTTIASQTNSSVSTQQADITSPSGKVTVEYVPSCQIYPSAGGDNDDVLSVASPPNIENFKIVKSIISIGFAGTPYWSSQYYLTSNDSAQQNDITPGNHIENDNQLGKALVFVNPKALNPSKSSGGQAQDNVQCLNVGKFLQLAPNDDVNTTTFSTSAKASEWFNDSEVQTGGQILNSVSFSSVNSLR